jgi:peptidoglycan/LPS O-acetylase OafA/YrhL
MINSKRIHYKEIDGLRALAVLAVMFFHLNDSILPGGFSGVDIFFVVSGYVVSKSLAERKFIDGYNYFVDFYSRRIIRIIPALLVMLVVVSIFTTLFIPSSWLSSAYFP